MIYLFTGQLGHGKTSLGLEMLLAFKAKGRACYVCNVRKFDGAKVGINTFTPEQFIDWPNQLPPGSVLLVDEPYEHGMMPRRAAGSKVPEHIQRLAKSRHEGYDFIFVTQSPTKQLDDFVHDLYEEHYHVRKRFGLPFVHVRRFDKYERNPDKATPLTIQRRMLPKKVFKLGLFESTTDDTSEKRVPWFYYAAALLLGFLLLWGWRTATSINDKFTQPSAAQSFGGNATGQSEAKAGSVGPRAKAKFTADEFVSMHSPRFPGWHGSQPAFDNRTVQAVPRTFCVMSGGPTGDESCTCYTEQVTRLREIPGAVCRHVARYGEYDPFLPPPAPGRSESEPVVEPSSEASTVAGTGSDPGKVGHGDQGKVWGRAPATLRASGG